ncbi:MAG: hypothetical protein WD556_07910 [Actinomycetota bacterium]
MNVDERDEGLGDLLDRAVRGIGVEGVPSHVVRRGSRRRVGTVLAAVTITAVFVAGVGFAATQVGRDAHPSPASSQGWTTLSAPDIPWTTPVPPGWRVGVSRFVGGPHYIIQALRASFVTNAAIGAPRSFRSFGGPFRDGAPGDTVVVMVDESVGQGEDRPTDLTFNRVHRIPGAEGWTSRDGKICSEWGCVRVYLEQGPDASRSDIDTATRVAEGVKPERVAPSPTTLTPLIRYEDQDLQAAGFSLRYPAGWVVADDPLTDLRAEIVSIGTYDLQPGGRSREGLDAVIPAALDGLGADDVFITVQEYQEYKGARAANARPRPASFSAQAVCADQRCLDGRRLGFDGMRAWWISFEDAASGRTLSALVAMGETAFADPARNDAAWEVLDSVEFDRSG